MPFLPRIEGKVSTGFNVQSGVAISYLDNQSRIECRILTGTLVSTVAAGITDDPGAGDGIIQAGVGVAVDPELGVAQQMLQPGSEAGGKLVILILRHDRLPTWGVVSHNSRSLAPNIFRDPFSRCRRPAQSRPPHPRKSAAEISRIRGAGRKTQPGS